MKKIIIYAISTILSVGAAQAAPNDATISLLDNNVTIAPHGGLYTLSLNPLLKHVRYKVSCKITNENVNNVAMRFDIAIHSMTINSYWLNGEQLETQQGLLLSDRINTSEADVISYLDGNGLTFMNLDNSSTVMLHDCVGKPMTGM